MTKALCSSLCGRCQPWGLETTHENYRHVVLSSVQVTNCLWTRRVLGVGFRVEGHFNREFRISFGIRCSRYFNNFWGNLGAGIDGVDGFEMRAEEEGVIASPRDLQHAVS